MLAGPKGAKSPAKGFIVAAAIVAVLAVPGDGLTQDAPLLGANMKLGRCDAARSFVLAIHGGTAELDNSYSKRTALMQDILAEARDALEGGAIAVDIVHAAVRAMEDSGVFNAGRGARANQAGVVEMDAAIMDGKHHDAGAVASVKRVKNPITAARMVMRRSQQVMLVGPDAEAFFVKNNRTLVDPSYFRLNGLDFSSIPLPDGIEVKPPSPDLLPELAGFSGVWGGVFRGSINTLLIVEEVTDQGARVVFGHGIDEDWGADKGHAARYQAEVVNGALRFETDSPKQGRINFKIRSDNALEAIYNPKDERRMTTDLRRLEAIPESGDHGTVGAVALDRCGDLAAATSTGGFGSKVPGRVGDSPIIGAGTFANNQTAAISATGEGEYFMRYVIAHDISALMEYSGLDLDAAARRAINGKLTLAGGRGGVIAVDAQGNVAMAFNTDGMLRGVVGNIYPLTVEVF